LHETVGYDHARKESAELFDGLIDSLCRFVIGKPPVCPFLWPLAQKTLPKDPKQNEEPMPEAE
jgi:hypothetical protein